MPRVILSTRAQSDIVRLRNFLLEKDINSAKRAVLAIREAFLPLKQSPIIGRPVEGPKSGTSIKTIYSSFIGRDEHCILVSATYSKFGGVSVIYR